MTQRKLISFDWAMKKMLRSKANFDILEGFLSELLSDDIKILEILESESNKSYDNDKFNRVDLLVKSKDDSIIIIELQYDYEYDFMLRMLYGTSKIVTEHMKQGAPYSEVKKVISINIVYFDLGQGKDYVYKGTTNFIGLHEKDELQLSQIQKDKLKRESIYQLYPEYYLLKINNFNDFAKNTLDEWIYFLKNEEIKPEFKAKGLKEAKDKLDIMKLSGSDLQSYNRHRENLHYAASMAESVKIEAEEKIWKKGLVEGEKLGLEKGEKLKAIKIAKNCLEKKMDYDTISFLTGLSVEEIRGL
ncbi:MAG: Rpn family recombination-promoting nuclease/putative transposase [Candidatus Delongbacteria bacterium]|nr:Rpn family recombination-promoting nuclease/putative transposase [Candidatus Delongbacteria bacterium]MBN2835981.1 Rpn family recombination-promoting nuclease/putative transposase [Candidatus Delongbacteria bacterium]